MSNSGFIIEELSRRCYNRDGQAQNYTKKFVLAVLKGLKREIDSVRVVGSMELAVTGEEPNVLELDDYAEELQNVFDCLSEVRLDPELLSASKKFEIDFMSRVDVYRKRPRNCEADKGIHVIQTKWVHVNKGEASDQCTDRDCAGKNSFGGTRSCQERLHRWDRSSAYCSCSPKR